MSRLRRLRTGLTYFAPSFDPAAGGISGQAGAGACGGVTSLCEDDRAKCRSARGGEQSQEWLRGKGANQEIGAPGLQKPHLLEATGWGAHLHFCGCRRERVPLLRLSVAVVPAPASRETGGFGSAVPRLAV